jgi:pyruvate formate lyase activating enzyme
MEAFLYSKGENNAVICDLCHHNCLIQPGKRGICRVRENRDGILTTLVYGRVIAKHIDPIEKKPLFHFLPGSLSYSVATVGCNFKCRFCQNADIAQLPENRNDRIAGEPTTPQEVVDGATRGNCSSIAYTYTEPTVFFEFAHDTAKMAHQKGLKNVFVTNGYMSKAAIDRIAPYLDAANVDLKAYSDDFYKTYCSARLEPVKETLRAMKKAGIFLEVTTLLIPGLNDDAAELGDLAAFIVNDLGPDVPWHVSRFYPTYRLMDRPPTPVASLVRAREIGMQKGLRYVYVGNVPGENGENTFCHQCHTVLIQRHGYVIGENIIQNSVCPKCGARIPGVF